VIGVIAVKQVRSLIGRKQDHKDTLRALGISRMGQTVYHEESPAIKGMVKKLEYMLEVTEVDVKDEG